MKFRNLRIGQSFDFISPNSAWNSFYKRCTKLSARRYQDEDGGVHTVGSINAKVYHTD